ncbi:hypothetical protein BPY_11620 [Bifidobacterium psychraerophilum]
MFIRTIAKSVPHDNFIESQNRKIGQMHCNEWETGRNGQFSESEKGNRRSTLPNNIEQTRKKTAISLLVNVP